MRVAILIPTMNRQDFVERIASYYNALNSPHPIYFGDASDHDYAARTANLLKRFKNVEIKYFHWEGLAVVPTIAKLAKEASRECQFNITTPDDDYFVPSSLTKCAQFLAKNEDYRSAQGRAAIFSLDRSGAYGKIRSLQKWWGVNALEQETGLDRLVHFRENYYGMQFSVHRMDEYLDDCKYYFEIKEGLLGEIFNNYTFAVMGKSKFIDCLYMIRNDHDMRCTSGILDWILRPSWSSDLEKCIDRLSLSLHEKDNLPLNQSRKVVTEMFRDFVRRVAFKQCRAKEELSFSSRVKRCMPIGLKNVLRSLNALTMDVDDMRLLRSQRSRFYEEFLPVYNSLNREASMEAEGR